jgi:hypothetical protein
MFPFPSQLAGNKTTAHRQTTKVFLTERERNKTKETNRPNAPLTKCIKSQSRGHVGHFHQDKDVLRTSYWDLILVQH